MVISLFADTCKQFTIPIHIRSALTFTFSIFILNKALFTFTTFLLSIPNFINFAFNCFYITLKLNCIPFLIRCTFNTNIVNKIMIISLLANTVYFIFIPHHILSTLTNTTTTNVFKTLFALAIR